VDVLRFGLLGLGTGGIYALVAMGVVLVYRASGVLNFASGTTGALAAYLFFDLRDNHDVAPWIALPASMALGAAIGGWVQVLIMSRLRTSSALTRLIATLGVLTLLTGVVTLVWGADQQLVSAVLPQSTIEIAEGFTIGSDRLLLIGLAVVVATVLKVLYSRTTFGLATSAVAENRRGAASLGWSTTRIELANWMIGGALSALAAVLLAAITGLQITTLTLLVIPALAAALVGGFSSFALTVAGAMVLGVLQAELARFVAIPGVGDSVPFLVIIIVIFVGGRSRPSRADLPTRLPIPGSGQINKPALVLVAAALAVIVWTVPEDWAGAMTTLFVWGVVVLSVVVVTGYAGQPSLGQWALAGMGAWVASVLVANQGLPFWLAAAAGVAATIPIGLVVAIPAMRTRGVELAVATLGLSLVITAFVLNNGSLTGGLDGIKVGSPHLFGIDLDDTVHPARYATLALIAFLGTGVLVANLRRGRTGRRMLAVRSNERAAAALGIGVYSVKLYAFGLAAALAAVAGILAGFRTQVVIFTQFDVFGSINSLMYAVIGGLGWASGPVFGAGLAHGTPGGKIIEQLGDVNAWLPIIGGGSVLLMLITNPAGLAALHATVLRPVGDLLNRATRRLGRRAVAEDEPKAPPVTSQARDVELIVTGLSVRYGGVQALDSVDLRVRSGQVVGLIGPNGAGKTTLLDTVTGFTRESAGSVVYDGVPVSGWSPVRRARAGIGRSFQSVELFSDMTVRENLLSAAEDHGLRSYLTDLLWPGRATLSPAVQRWVSEFGLADVLDVLPGELSNGTARLVGVARALATDPAILFLDEPAAGLDSHESAELGAVVRRIADEWGIGVVLVEHDVALVLGTCDHIVVLDFGRQIGAGTPEEIRHDQKVVRAYLGDEDSAVAPAPAALHDASRPA
jgi:ABC-type branched-subunit amino acid transport system ATPase component/branched-subunit amino acid ABC-type transport system permease component